MSSDSVNRTPGLLAAVNVERRRHLTFEELESLVDEATEPAVDAIARQHLRSCEICQSELSDLQAFEELLHPAAGRLSSPARQAEQEPPAPSPAWQWSPRFLMWAVATVAIAVVIAVLPRGTQTPDVLAAPMQIVVRLNGGGGAPGSSDNPSALRPTTGPPVSAELLQTIGRARQLATQTGQAQRIDVRVTRQEYAGLNAELMAIGTIEAGDMPDPFPAGGSEREPITVSVTILPPSR